MPGAILSSLCSHLELKHRLSAGRTSSLGTNLHAIHGHSLTGADFNTHSTAHHVEKRPTFASFCVGHRLVLLIPRSPLLVANTCFSSRNGGHCVVPYVNLAGTRCYGGAEVEDGDTNLGGTISGRYTAEFHRVISWHVSVVTPGKPWFSINAFAPWLSPRALMLAPCVQGKVQNKTISQTEPPWLYPQAK